MRRIEILTAFNRACFNPRTHVGCDIFKRITTRIITSFNPRTHVGCDSTCASEGAESTSFNPRTHVGCDVIKHYIIIKICKFQSTHPRRVRQAELVFGPYVLSFNPRTHVGCDITGMLTSRPTPSFNPRTHVGCDIETILLMLSYKLFQSTHPRRVRREVY